MGNASCRNKSECPRAPWKCRVKSSADSDDEEDSDSGRKRGIELADLTGQLSRFELEQVDDMRKLIELRPHVFLLDNILLGVQLFPNYEDDIKSAQKKLETREANLNANLLPEKFVILPDLLSEHFNGRLTFNSQQRSDEPIIEPLRPTRMYLVYDNVHVTELDNARYYSSADDFAVDYTFALRKTDRTGYVRLERKEISLKAKRNLNTIDSSSTSTFQDHSFSSYESVDDATSSKSQNGNSKFSTCSMPELRVDEMYGCSSRESGSSIQDLACNDELVFRMKQQEFTNGERDEGAQQWKAISSNSSSSGYTTNSSSTEGSYSLLASNGASIDPAVIPESCFVCLRSTNGTEMSESQSVDHPRVHRYGNRMGLDRTDDNSDVVYLSGRDFSRHFAQLVKNQLAMKLGLDSRSVFFTKRAGPLIRVQSVEFDVGADCNRVDQYEVRGCLTSSWPSWARSWVDRVTQSEWPGPELARQVYATDCVLLPEAGTGLTSGIASAVGRGRLDWSLSWPAAERLLEASLTPAHASVHTVGLLLLKSYCASGSGVKSSALSAQHLGNQLFWMVEQQPSWSELRMGSWLMRLLESLRWSIQRRNMPDYFLPERNLLAFNNDDSTSLSSVSLSSSSSSASSSTSRIASDKLLLAQKQLARLIENPVMYLLHALEQMHYRRPFNFPEFDYRGLIRLLTVDELWLSNPSLAENASNAPVIEPRPQFQQHQQNFWSEAKLASHCQRRINVKRSCRPTDEPIHAQRTPDSIVDITEKCEPLRGVRLSHVLIFFLEHLLRVARRCHDLGANRAKQACLKQTKLLAVLLASESNSRQDYLALAADFMREAHDLSLLATIPTSTRIIGPRVSTAPETPKRNAPEPNLSSIEASVEVHSSEIRSPASETLTHELVTSF